jgi:hypothetical protein
MAVIVHHGDSRDVLKTIADASIDSCVCDPPYALVSIVKRFGKQGSAPAKGNAAYMRASAGFMGKTWDTGETAFDPDFWREVLRVLKPGGHIVAASGTRTYHRLACAIEDAGFEVGPSAEIRDMITNWIASGTHAGRFLASLGEEQMRALLLAADEREFAGMFGWLYGSGFPKSHDVAKGIDKAELKITRGRAGRQGDSFGQEYERTDKGEPISENAKAWDGWGTALKPACEPWVLARKPLNGTVASNVLKHGTGALNIDGARIGAEGGTRKERSDNKSLTDSVGGYLNADADAGVPVLGLGRWPANVIHDGSDEVVDAFGDTSTSRIGQPRSAAPGEGWGMSATGAEYSDSGSAARFFYTAKADAEDRMGSKHPTVKPVNLMAYLCRLVTPPGGTVLDPFAGSGSTGVACIGEGFNAILIEREAEYVADIHRRIAWVKGDGRLTAQEVRQPAQDAESALPLFVSLAGAE